MVVDRAARVPRVALVGASGFGRTHLSNLGRLQSRVDLVGVADPRPPEEGALPPGVPLFESLEELISALGAPDIVIISTPIHTHERLTGLALRTGADVYLEKPAVPSMAAFERLTGLMAETGRVVQVGFQSFGSHALAQLDADAFGLGPLVSIGAVGTWMRTREYWARSSWSGRRRLGDVDVVDGVITNPLAHAVATALRIARAQEVGDVESVAVDLYRANDIEADDTSVVRLVTRTGIPLTAALTLCAAESAEPFIVIEGTRSTARYWYTRDLLELADGTRHRFERTDLLENLIAFRADGVPLIAPLASTGSFMRVVEAVRVADEPRRIDGRYIDWQGEDEGAHPVVEGVVEWIGRAVAGRRDFAEVGAPWAAPTLQAAEAESRGGIA